MEQVSSSWQIPGPCLIQAAETNDSDIDCDEVADLDTHTAVESESSFFNSSSFNNEAVED